MPRLEKMMLALFATIIVTNIAIITLKIAKMDEKFDRIIEFEGMNEIVAD